MTRPKHTPGPWRVGKTCGAVVADSPLGTHSDDDNVRYYGGALIAESICSDENARLIAAAPDLLKAIEAYLGTHPTRTRRARDLALAAIAKVNGEDQ